MLKSIINDLFIQLPPYFFLSSADLLFRSPPLSQFKFPVTAQHFFYSAKEALNFNGKVRVIKMTFFIASFIEKTCRVFTEIYQQITSSNCQRTICNRWYKAKLRPDVMPAGWG
jgi:hypothetical protein